MARAKKHRATKVQRRISPTEALRIMMTRMAAPRGVQRLTEAMHDWKCRIWRDGKLVPRAEVGHLSVLESYDDKTGQYHASIGDDRWDAVRGEYEFDADEVRALPADKRPTPQAREGSAITWIKHVCPNDEWLLMTAKDIRNKIVPEAKRLGATAPSYSAVAAGLRELKQQT